MGYEGKTYIDFFSLYIIKGLERLGHYFEKKLFIRFVRNWGGGGRDAVNSES